MTNEEILPKICLRTVATIHYDFGEPESISETMRIHKFLLRNMWYEYTFTTGFCSCQWIGVENHLCILVFLHFTTISLESKSKICSLDNADVNSTSLFMNFFNCMDTPILSREWTCKDSTRQSCWHKYLLRALYFEIDQFPLLSQNDVINWDLLSSLSSKSLEALSGSTSLMSLLLFSTRHTALQNGQCVLWLWLGALKFSETKTIHRTFNLDLNSEILRDRRNYSSIYNN